MKYKVIVEYEYPVEHKTPVKAELTLHGDRVETWDIKPLEPTTKNDLGVDAISRKQAIEEADKLCLETGYDNEKVIEMLNELPSVTPQPRKGKWLSRWHAGHDLHFHVCSECNEEFSCDMETGISIDNYRYCPNCGAKMVEPQAEGESQESEDT